MFVGNPLSKLADDGGFFGEDVMWAAVEHSISNVIVLVIIASLGYWVARRGIADAAGRKLVRDRKSVV